MISKSVIEKTAFELLKKAATDLPRETERHLRNAHKKEGGIAKSQLDAIIENVKLSRKEKIPICQDTGIPLFYVNIGTNASIRYGDIESAINSAVVKATKKIPLRPNVVDPISRKNNGNNRGPGMPWIETWFLPGRDFIEMAVFLKGGGSENMSALKMLKPSEGIMGVKRFVIETVANARGMPCPPVVVGVGIGGSSDIAMKLAKYALLRKNPSKDKKIARLEKELLRSMNKLGIGPMGLGGRTTALSVKIETAGCHTASLPVGVNIQCWADRKATARVYRDRVMYL